MWTDKTAAIADIRRLISDGDTDKFCDQKLVFGKIDGNNVRFKSFERRRVSDFTVDADDPSPVGVYINFERISAASVATDDLVSGSFTLTTPPEDGQEVRASYYYHWFLDEEIEQFLMNAAQWLGYGIDTGLNPEVFS
jgi:hypothetical protein